MKIYCNAFWGGFLEYTDPVHVGFFIELLSKVFDEPCSIGNIDESDILLESMFGTSILHTKAWKKTIYFLGERRQPICYDNYDIVLCCERNNKNIVNCPLFIPFLYCRNSIEEIQKIVTEVPRNDIVAIITNPTATIRNSLIERIEAENIPIIFAGSYRNNIGVKLPGVYCDEGYINFIKQFKFIISMENTNEGTYITEKICSGFLANIIPIYWGTKQVFNYFNSERFIYMDDKNPDDAIQKIKYVSDPQRWLTTVNKPVFHGGTLWRTIDDIARDCKTVLHPFPMFPNIRQIYYLNLKTDIDIYAHIIQYMPNMLDRIYEYTLLFKDIIKRYSSSEEVLITKKADISSICTLQEYVSNDTILCTVGWLESLLEYMKDKVVLHEPFHVFLSFYMKDMKNMKNMKNMRISK